MVERGTRELNTRKSGTQVLGVYKRKYLGMDIATLERINPRLIATAREGGVYGELKEIVRLVRAYNALESGKRPTPKQLRYGDQEEREMYNFFKKNGLLSIVEHYRPYGDPEEYYRLVHNGKTIGQVQRVDPNFVNYCRYHGIEEVMPKVIRNPWEGREEEAFREKWGDLSPGKVSTLGPEGHRDYMRLYRSRKKKSAPRQSRED
ncbi:hypothetical protein K2P56_02145 [Patescibacteria group bacterium]|nr:hypothetical protein [Patescibacteria group bacterium]